ncbi:MAG: hypothetical protein GAK40_01238 [Burkholderia plantarii]|nr:MAG: hypothetical protein GAK40_01238 [Burkholderia plantarii]
MSSAAIGALMFALLLAAAGLLLWRGSRIREQSAHTRRFIDSRLEPAARAASANAPAAPGAGAPGNGAGAAAAEARRHRLDVAQAQAQSRPLTRDDGIKYWLAKLAGHWQSLSNRAGLDEVRPILFALAAAVVLIMLWLGLRGGLISALAAAVCGVAIIALWIMRRSSARRLKIVRQLPAFLDGVVRLVTLGNSVPAAFRGALNTTEMPLRQCLDQVSRMLRTGVEIDRALLRIAREYRIDEFELLGSVLKLSVKYGGRADVMLERLAAFMRDLEQAERELYAMSAETRLSAWVLGLLPLAIGGFVVARNPRYFSAMLMSNTGHYMLYVAFAMQLLGGFMLYRMARLK